MGLADLLFPKRCFGCGRRGSYICVECIVSQETKPQRCLVCGRNSIDGLTHIACRNKYTIDGAISIWSYEEAVRSALISLKYRFAREVAREIAALTANRLKSNFTPLPRQAILTPVPLFKKRENWRGFNQAEEIGKLIAGEFGWRFVKDLILRGMETVPQTGLLRTDRKKNLKGVFKFNRKYLSLVELNTPIIIFDDVCTTGTTLLESARVLKKAGLGVVWGLTVAR